MDMTEGRVVKGIKFKELKDAGDPVELAAFYNEEGADELVFLDITASYEKRDILIDVVSRTADRIFIPFTVGGGIRNIEDIRQILSHGADKVTINTAAVKNPNLIKESAGIFGSQCIVSSVDIKRVYVSDESEAPDRIVLETPEGKCWWSIYIYGGREEVKLDAFKWCEKVVELGAGEFMISSLDFDGTQKGYDLIFLRELSDRVPVPIIASSGAGTPEHLLEALTIGNSDAALAASIFHYGTYSIKEIKEFLAKKGVSVRL